MEQSLTDRVSVAGYFSGVNTDGNYFTDRDGRAIGFGYPGSPSSNNRTIQEWTATGAYQIVRTPDRGSAQFNTQVSWLTRVHVDAAERVVVGTIVHVFRAGSLQPA